MQLPSGKYGVTLAFGDKVFDAQGQIVKTPSTSTRFPADAVLYSVRFAAGYPACVPGGLGDVCAAASRPVRGVVDAALLLPIRLGDDVTAQGAFEVVDGVRIFSAHSLVDHTSPVAPGR